MTIDDVRNRLAENGYTTTKEERLSSGLGSILRLGKEAVVTVFDNGTVQCQGKKGQDVQALFANSLVAGEPVTADVANKRIFVVYGHEKNARQGLEAMLLRWGLEPLILDQLPSEGQTIIEKLENYTGKVGFAVVLATPDDEGHRAEHPDEKSFRARQNVVLELGMLLAKLGRSKVAILLKQQEHMERPSDIQGLIYIPFKDDVNDARILLAKEMDAQGYRIAVNKL
ncbi:MAG: hypothetical protein QOK48_2537 [Blastocatellia bacterium]|jgi:predicted nucleotide-binding protein|nr:hypothetical protein [Blastocatellia bacterium]